MSVRHRALCGAHSPHPALPCLLSLSFPSALHPRMYRSTLSHNIWTESSNNSYVNSWLPQFPQNFVPVVGVPQFGQNFGDTDGNTWLCCPPGACA